MATGKKPDPRKRKNAHPHASGLTVLNGEKFGTWKGGEIHGIYGHRTHATKPCLDSVTNGELVCPYCQAEIPLVFRAYVPLFDVNWAVRFVIIGEPIYEAVDAIPFRTQVLVSRHKNPNSPLIVRELTTMTRELPDRAPWDAPVDMLRICLTLWDTPALTAWYAKNPPAPVAVPKPVPLK